MTTEKTLREILEIVQFLKENAITKEDLKDYPTKKELKAELKAELSNYATKEDLKALATKADLNDLRFEMFEKMATKEELVAVKNELLNHIDGFC